MGVWIETTNQDVIHIIFASHPVWVCGLKLYMGLLHIQASHVTPCMGVWIETKYVERCPSGCSVTPCMGVWIETES